MSSVRYVLFTHFFAPVTTQCKMDDLDSSVMHTVYLLSEYCAFRSLHFACVCVKSFAFDHDEPDDSEQYASAFGANQQTIVIGDMSSTKPFAQDLDYMQRRNLKFVTYAKYVESTPEFRVFEQHGFCRNKLLHDRYSKQSSDAAYKQHLAGLVSAGQAKLPLVIGGAPGSGRTTVAKRLLELNGSKVHVVNEDSDGCAQALKLVKSSGSASKVVFLIDNADEMSRNDLGQYLRAVPAGRFVCVACW